LGGGAATGAPATLRRGESDYSKSSRDERRHAHEATEAFIEEVREWIRRHPGNGDTLLALLREFMQRLDALVRGQRDLH
jgi:hypothetical protein